MPSRRRVLLFIHGCIDDDPQQRWRTALDHALAREGGADLDQLGWETPAMSYLDVLDGPEPDATRPDETHRTGHDAERQRALSEYLLRITDLHRSLPDETVRKRPVYLPPSSAAEAAIATLQTAVCRCARTYSRSEAKRHAILRRVLEAVPASSDLVIIGHSLGSVVAADLVYHLPRTCRLKLLVTTGSPLALNVLSRHLRRQEREFPYESIGAWLNLAGASDPIPSGRGLGHKLPEILDRVVDTGGDVREAHSSWRYMDEGTAAKALTWVDEARMSRAAARAEVEPRTPDELLLPLVLLQHGWRIEQQLKQGTKRSRYAAVRRAQAAELRETYRPIFPSAGVVDSLGRDHHRVLSGRFSPQQKVEFLVAARRWNPIQPWEIAIAEDDLKKAHVKLGADLGAPPTWAEAAWLAEKDARDCHGGGGLSVKRIGLIGVGVAAALAAPYLVLAAAPAGLAGGAAVLGGLAALGPGGLAGGLAIVGLVGVGGGVVAAQGLSAGSSEAVEENVIAIQAIALALHELGVEPSDRAHWFLLVEMEEAVVRELQRHIGHSDDDAPARKELDRKLKAIRRGLEWMRKRGLGPRALQE